jgi:micrococcal nuclease
VLGRSVELAFAGRHRDRYNRLLAHVFVRSGAQRLWVQGRLVRDGRARAYSLPENTACIEDLIGQEARAREEAAALWAHPAYKVRSAQNTRELLRLRRTTKSLRDACDGSRPCAARHTSISVEIGGWTSRQA